MSKYSELANRLDDAPAVGKYESELLGSAAAALRELEAENRMYSESLANATQEIERLESRLAAALHLIPGNVLIGELRELAERYRAALEDKG